MKRSKPLRRGAPLPHGKTRMKRTRMKTRNAKRKGSSFPKVRAPRYRRWVWTANPCMLAGSIILRRFSQNDVVPWHEPDPRALLHCCWGNVTPAHVGDHQATGAPDFGVLVPLCVAAHQFYDEHRSEWQRATGYTETQMAAKAVEYGAAYVASQGGAVSEQGEP